MILGPELPYRPVFYSFQKRGPSNVRSPSLLFFLYILINSPLEFTVFIIAYIPLSCITPFPTNLHTSFSFSIL